MSGVSVCFASSSWRFLAYNHYNIATVVLPSPHPDLCQPHQQRARGVRPLNCGSGPRSLAPIHRHHSSSINRWRSPGKKQKMASWNSISGQTFQAIIPLTDHRRIQLILLPVLLSLPSPTLVLYKTPSLLSANFFSPYNFFCAARSLSPDFALRTGTDHCHHFAPRRLPTHIHALDGGRLLEL